MIYEKFDDWFFELESHCLRAERFYEGLSDFQHDKSNTSDIVGWLKAAFEAGASLAESKQACIDRLMLEFCPGEMTDEQWKRWTDCQKPVEK